MSEIWLHLPYVLYSVPFILAAGVLVKARLDARRDQRVADYERYIWPDQPEETEVADRPVHRRYISYSS